MTLRLEQSKLMQMSKEPPWNWNNSFSSPENLRKKTSTYKAKITAFSVLHSRKFWIYMLDAFFLWHSALITFVASATNDVSKVKRQSRDTTRILSTEKGEGVDIRIRTSSDHSFFWARYEHFIDKVTRRFLFCSNFLFLTERHFIGLVSRWTDVSVCAWPAVVAALTIALFVRSILSYKFLYNCYVVCRNSIACNLAVFKPYDAHRGLINLCKTESIIWINSDCYPGSR